MKDKLMVRDGYLFNVYKDSVDQAYVVYEVYEPRTEEHCILKRTTDKKGKTKWWGMPMDDEKIYELIFKQFPYLKERKTLAMFGRVYEFLTNER